MTKTNAMRILDKNKISYETIYYETDHFETGLKSAKLAHIDINLVYKTIVTYNKDDCYIFIINVNDEIDLKKASKLANVKSLELLPLKDLTLKTGYVRGGCTALGMKKNYPCFLDNSALLNDDIVISGGKIGLSLKLKTSDLIKVLNITLGDIIRG